MTTDKRLASLTDAASDTESRTSTSTVLPAQSDEAIGVQREWRLKAPGSETEQMVAEMWKRVLQIEQVGVEDNFFDLGGDSLKAQRILAQIERELGISIPVRIAFANPTVARLSLHIDRARRVGMTDEEELMTIIEALSDEEVIALLGKAMQFTESES